MIRHQVPEDIGETMESDKNGSSARDPPVTQVLVRRDLEIESSPLAPLPELLGRNHESRDDMVPSLASSMQIGHVNKFIFDLADGLSAEGRFLEAARLRFAATSLSDV